MGKEKFQEFLRSIEEEERREKSIDWNKKKKEFLEAVKEFYSFVEECLEPYREKVSISYEPIEITEEKLGTYSCEKMIIEIGNRKATFTPIGTILIAASGRIDLEGPSGKVKIVRVPENASAPAIFIIEESTLSGKKALSGKRQENTAKDVWKIATPPPGIRYIDLNCDTFLDVLMQVVK